MTVDIALTIASSDSGGGSGVQADIKTFQELGVYGTSVITAVAAQNTLGVQAVYPVPVEGVIAQLQSVLDDFRVSACKTGMLLSAEVVSAVADMLKQHPEIPIIVDPVMLAKSGHVLLQEDALEALKEKLLPLAAVATPNIPEAKILTGIQIKTDEDIRAAAQKILAFGAKAVVIKGGHRCDLLEAKDYYADCDGQSFTVTTPWVHTKNTHGTGCTFASALTAFIAKGCSMSDAAAESKQFIQAAIEDSLRIGAGHGPTNHAAYNKLRKAMQ